MGQELAQRFAGTGINKILTVEASGIAIAMAVGLALKVPVVFAKKKQSSTLVDSVYSSQIYSFTRKEAVDIYVSAKFLSEADCGRFSSAW
jgi:xanthine phosphoribosyltransferase